MKIETKYDLGEKVFILLNNKIISSSIDSIRITQHKPSRELQEDCSVLKNDGREEEYLVCVKKTVNKNRTVFSGYDYINVDRIGRTESELISKIK